MYTSYYFDKLTVSSFLAPYNEYTSFLKPICIPKTGSDITHVLKIIGESINSREPLYFMLHNLSIITIQKQLFMEIISQNNMTKAEENRCLYLYDILQHYINMTDLSEQGV